MSRALLALTIAVTVLASSVVPVGVATAVGGSGPAGDVSGPAIAGQSEPTTTTNETQHRDPDEYDEEGDIEELTRWLSGAMASRLGNSTIHLSQGQYEQARSAVGTEYDDLLGRYVDVAGETEGDGDDETAETYETARERQTDFTSAVQRYNETRARYEDARRAGEEERARRLARRLERLEGQVARNASRVTRSFEAIENRTDVDLGGAIARVRSVESSVAETQTTIREREFEQTTIALSLTRRSVSFAAPIALQGTLQSVTGDPLADRRVTVTAGNWSTTVTTGTGGSFSVTHRPVRLEAGEQPITATYRPAEAAGYLRSSTTRTVAVAQTVPTLQVEPIDGAHGFAETVSVEGRVVVAEDGVPDLPVRLSIGETVVGRTTTDADGWLSTAVAVPASVPAGEATLTVAVDQRGRAIAGASAETRFDVASTPSSLSVSGSATAETLTVDGRLVAGGVGVPDQPVRVFVDGSRVGTVETASDGSFTHTVARSSIGEAASVRLEVRYLGRGSSIGASAASTTYSLTGDGTSTAPGDGPGGEPRESLLDQLPGGLATAGAIVGGGLLLVLGSAYAMRRRRGGPAEPSSAPPGVQVDAGDVDTEPAAPLSTARDALDAGEYDTAVEDAYETARSALGGRAPAARTATHWEFLRSQRGALNGTSTTDLETLTELYELAAFAPYPMDGAGAQNALAAAERLLTAVDGS